MRDGLGISPYIHVHTTMSIPIVVDLTIPNQQRVQSKPTHGVQTIQRFSEDRRWAGPRDTCPFAHKVQWQTDLVEGEKDQESTVWNDKDMCVYFEGY
jgi:hypothetical protein